MYPSILQTILAFKEYYLGSGVWGSEWAGLSNFKFIFSDARMQMVIWQTVYLSFLRLLAGIIPAVLFALVFYHITSKKYRSVVQTIVYIPHFFQLGRHLCHYFGLFNPQRRGQQYHRRRIRRGTDRLPL